MPHSFQGAFVPNSRSLEFLNTPHLIMVLCSFQQTIANFGSKAESVAKAEFKALQYFWWFMVLTAFSGQLLANMALSALNEGFGSQFQELLRTIALTIPSQISVNWINWIIFRFTIILPLNYLVQVNTFLFHFFRMYCCARMVRGTCFLQSKR